MRKRMGWVAFWVFAAGAAIGADSTAPPAEAQVADATKAPQVPQIEADKHADIHRFFHSLSGAFEKGDAKLLGLHFAPKARYTHRLSGRRIEGREAIGQLYRDIFEPGRVKSVDLALEDVRQVSPDVAAVSVVATVHRADGPPVRTILDTLLTRRDSKWQLDSVSEIPVPAMAHPYDHLNNLAFLVGEWQDQEGKLDVQTTGSWADNHSFINRTFTVAENGKKLHEGTEKIGFDAVEGVIRSWTFENDGSFGEGVWAFDGERWTVRQQGRNAAGLNVSATQVITPLGTDSYTTQLVGREIGGKILPNGPVVKVVREKK